MPLTHEDRVRNGRLGAHLVHARGNTNTAAARRGFEAKFEREVDPEGILDPVERAKRADHARRAYYLQLAAKGRAARSRKVKERSK